MKHLPSILQQVKKFFKTCHNLNNYDAHRPAKASPLTNSCVATYSFGTAGLTNNCLIFYIPVFIIDNINLNIQLPFIYPLYTL